MPTQNPPLAEETGRSPVLPVREVIARVQEWVDRYARPRPDFAGAYLWAGITALPPDAPFPLYRDVDVVIVLTEGAPDDEEEFFYRGLLLEVIWQNLAAHQDAAAVLASPSKGPNLATTRILADPTGTLEPLRRAVAAEYPRRRWVQARCAAEQAAAEEALAAMRQAATPADRLNAARFILGMLSGLLALAQLRRPTTRRTLALLRELLDEQERPDLNEAALTVMGSVHLSRADVQALLDQCVRAFDRAIEVHQTPIPYGFALRPHLRPYHVEGTQEMIDEGNHREALFWITCLDTAYLALEQDAPEPEKSAFAAQFEAMLAALGFTDDAAWPERVAVAERLAAEIYALVGALAAQHPE
jgi:hypothetical protein